MDLSRYLDVTHATDVETFRKRLVECAGELGFGFVNSVLVEPRTSSAELPVYHEVGNTPVAFQEAAQNADNRSRDPVTQILRKSTVPFCYDQRLYTDAEAGDLWEEQAQFGYKSGIALAMELPDNRRFFIGVDRDSGLPSRTEELTRLMGGVALLAFYAKEAAERLLLPSAPVPSLTPREREVLQLTLQGKSAWVVGQLLGVGEDAIHAHAKRINKKFGVSSKTEAARIAVKLGLI